MKTITIGRGDGADIIIDDEMISRRHAVLKISIFGKMEIVDMGKNGTFVNGIKIKPNQPYPVTRKDVINIAEVTQLDWSQVPDNMRYVKYVVATLIAILLLIISIIYLNRCEGEKTIPNKVDTTETVTSDPASQNVVTPPSNKADSVPTDSGSKGKGAQKRDTEGKSLEQLLPHRKKNIEKEKKKEKEKNKTEDKKSDDNKTIII